MASESKSVKNPPNKRGSHCTVSVGESLYVWGGAQAGLPLVHDNEVKRRFNSNIQHFTPSTGQWTTRGTSNTPPLGFFGYCCTAINDQLYYFGGYCGHDICYHNSITQLDTVSLQWRKLEPTDATRPVMRRGFGGMISFEHDGVHHLLMIGGTGSKPAVQLPHQKYIQRPDGRWHTNEHSMYNISSRKWSNPLIIGQCIPPTNAFIIEKISNTRAVLFGGTEADDDAKLTYTNNIYILEISISTVFWQCMKKPEAIDQWPVGRYFHAGAIIITGSDCPMLVISGGINKNEDILDDCWICNITQISWIKLDVPHSVNKRHGHSLSMFVMSPHCVWIITVGGFDFSDAFITNPNIAMLTELVTNSKGEWLVGDTLDTNGINNEEYTKKYQQTMQAFMKSLEEKEKNLQEREREVRFFCQQIEQKEREIAEKDQEIRRYHHQLQEKDRELQEAQQLERKKEIEKELKDKTLETKKFLEHLQQKDKKISEKKMKELEDKESEIHKLNQLLQNKDKELTERDQKMKIHSTQDELKGVHVAAKKSFLIFGGSTQSANWEEYGIRITIPQGAVLPSDTVEVTITALVGGYFIFPESTELVSAVYAINTSKPFLEIVKLEIQHCVSIKTSSHCNFSFATAPSDKAPYQFKLVNGGNFVPNGGYGNIYVSEFCLWSLIEYVRTSISFFTNKSYYGQVIREVRRPGREWLIKFLLSKDLNALKKHINEEFKNNETINDLYFSFEEENDFIEFCFNKPCPKGWSVTPYDTPTKVSQRAINDYGSMSPPNFPQRLIKITAKPGEGADEYLNYPVTLRGIKSDIKKLNIVLTTVNAMIQQSLTPSYDPVDSPTNHKQLLNTSHLVDILDILKKHGYSGVSYYDLGLRLGLHPRTLNVIENEHRDVSSHFRICLEKWLQQADDVKSKGGPTYDTLIQALKKMGENAVADGIERESKDY